MKKKIIMMAMTLVLSLAILTGCGKAAADNPSVNDISADNAAASNEDDSDIVDSTDSSMDGLHAANNSGPSESSSDIKDSIDSSVNHTDAEGSNGSNANRSASTENSTNPSSENNTSSGRDNTNPSSENNTSSGGDNTHSADSSVYSENSASEETISSTDSNTAPTSSAMASIDSETVSAEDYLNDIREFFEVNEAEIEELAGMSLEDMIAGLQAIVEDLNVSTPEGLAMKADLQEMVDIVVNVFNMDNYDENTFNAASERINELSKLAEEHTNAFLEAALAAGVDRETLAEFDINFNM